MTRPDELAWYVYCVLPADATAGPNHAILPGRTARALPIGGFTLLVSEVPRALFEEGDPACRTGDPDWMAARIQAHHAVNAAAATTGPSLPLTFGVLFSGLAPLAAWLAERAASLQAALDQVRGRTEWALMLTEDEAAHTVWLEATNPDLVRLAAAEAAAGQGTGFLLARQRHKTRLAIRAAHLDQVARTLQSRLESAPLTVLPETGSGASPRWTLLAPPDLPVVDIAAGLAEPLAATGLTLRLTGPWPPYAFARAAISEAMHHA